MEKKRPSFSRISDLAIYGLFTILFPLLIVSCQQTASHGHYGLAWYKDLPLIGSQSSPRTSDLNKDGTLDIVIGAGQNEFQKTDMGILAFDGKSGELLWKHPSVDQVFGSAAFCDVNADGIADIFIGGRSPQLKAIDGKSGNLIWDYDPNKYANDPILKYARYNFNNGVMVPDQNGDGINDLLMINGGNPLAPPYSEADRYPGVLMLFDPKNGNILAADTMPDGKESYMTPLCFRQPGSNDIFLLFGSGGETIDGNLYISTLAGLLAKKLSAAKIIATEKGHGFIAPATVADVNKDGFADIIAISHGSKAIAIDGKDYHPLWTKTFPGTECSNSLSPGYFTGDDIPDFFTFVSKGQWPNSTGSVQVMLDGKTGTLVFEDSLGCTGFSSPVIFDLNGDGYDEAIISINNFDCSLGYASKSPKTIENKLIAVNFKERSVDTIDAAKDHKNVFSTPWIGDLDKDGMLDIINCQYYHYGDLISFLGMRIKRISTGIEIKKPIAWGAFLGSHGDGIFEDRHRPVR